jgi:hypothetical protein
MKTKKDKLGHILKGFRVGKFLTSSPMSTGIGGAPILAC